MLLRLRFVGKFVLVGIEVTGDTDLDGFEATELNIKLTKSAEELVVGVLLEIVELV
jgi:hypothetical protein